MMNNQYNKIALRTLTFLVMLAGPFSLAFAGIPPTMSVLPATGITTSTADLNGYYVSNDPNLVTTVSFRYGLSTTALSLTTPGQMKSTAEGTYSAHLTNLTAGTTYYFQAVGVNTSGTGYSSVIGAFQTTGNIQGPTQCNNGIDDDYDGKADAQDPNCHTDGNASNAASYNSADTNEFYITPVQNQNQNQIQVITPPQTNPCTINSFYAASTSIDYGASTTLYWNTSNCTTVSITNMGIQAPNGSANTGVLYGTTNYTLTASGTNTVYDYETVTVGTIIQNNGTCVINSFYADDDSIDEGDSTELTWNTTGCDSVSISGPIDGNEDDADGSIDTDDLDEDETFKLTAFGPYNTDTNSLEVEVDQDNNSNDDDNDNNTGTSMCNNGFDDDGDGYVDYGDPGCTATYGSSEYPYNSYGNPVVPNPIITYQPVPDPIVVNPPIKYIYTNTASAASDTGTFVEDTGSTMLLVKLENRFHEVRPDETIFYTLTYQNIGNKTLYNTVVTVTLPESVTFQNATTGSFSPLARTLEFSIGKIPVGGSGTIGIQALADRSLSNRDRLVTSALAVFTLSTSTTGTQYTSSAYVINEVSNGSFLGAFALGAGFFPTSFLGWLVLIAIILFIIVVARRLQKKESAHGVHASH